MKVSVVVITKNRPLQVQRLIDSIFCSRSLPMSIVLIDDSCRENFENTEKALLPYRDFCRHRSSTESRKELKKGLKKINLTKAQMSFVETCVGIRSPFLEFAKSLSGMAPFRDRFSAILSQSFGPYSVARNLGIYNACRSFNPDRIVFLDDDCYMKDPEKLKIALQLIGRKVNGKEVIAVSGLYDELCLTKKNGRHTYEKRTPTSVLTGMSSFLEKSFLTNQEHRLTLTPYHMLGGALILSKRVFSLLPFDPFIPRGEDHAYSIDLRDRYAKDFALVRDNSFVIQHDKQPNAEQRLKEKNTLRDIFRFIYLRFKVGRYFIPNFTIRWSLNAVIHMFLQAPRSRERILELVVLLFLARDYARRYAHEYNRTVNAWNSFLKAMTNTHTYMSS